MSDQRQRRWDNVVQMLCKGVVFAVKGRCVHTTTWCLLLDFFQVYYIKKNNAESPDICK